MAKRNSLTNKQKLEIKRYANRWPNLTQLAIQDYVRETFHVIIGRSTVQRILSTPERAFSLANPSQKKNRRVRFPQLERALLKYVMQYGRNMAITDNVLVEQGRKLMELYDIPFETLNLSNGWIQKFKLRNGITRDGIRNALSGTPMSTRQISVSTEMDMKSRIQLGTEEYGIDSVFVIESVYLNYKNQTLDLESRMDNGRDESQLLLGICYNISGSEKGRLTILHERVIEGTEEWMSESVNFSVASPLRWTRDVIQRWLLQFLKSIGSRPIALLVMDNDVYNCITQCTIENAGNVMLFSMQKQCCFQAQNVDVGLSTFLRAHYKRCFLQWYLQNQDSNLLDSTAIAFAISIWRSISIQSIQRCWQIVGFKMNDQEIVPFLKNYKYAMQSSAEINDPPQLKNETTDQLSYDSCISFEKSVLPSEVSFPSAMSMSIDQVSAQSKMENQFAQEQLLPTDPISIHIADDSLVPNHASMKRNACLTAFNEPLADIPSTAAIESYNTLRRFFSQHLNESDMKEEHKSLDNIGYKLREIARNHEPTDNISSWLLHDATRTIPANPNP